MALKLITAPAESPISLAYVKEKLRVDHDDDDLILEGLILGNTAYCDGPLGFLKRALVTQTWELTIDGFPDDEIEIPLSPLQEIESIKYDDGAGDEQTFDSASYFVDNVSEPGWVIPDGSWPSTIDGINTVRVRFIAGYPSNNDSPAEPAVPEDIKMAILLRVKADYDGGDNAQKLRDVAENILRQKRLHLSMA